MSIQISIYLCHILRKYIFSVYLYCHCLDYIFREGQLITVHLLKGNELHKFMIITSVIYCNCDIMYDYCKTCISRIKVFIQDKKNVRYWRGNRQSKEAQAQQGAKTQLRLAYNDKSCMKL